MDAGADRGWAMVVGLVGRDARGRAPAGGVTWAGVELEVLGAGDVVDGSSGGFGLGAAAAGLDRFHQGRPGGWPADCLVSSVAGRGDCGGLAGGEYCGVDPAAAAGTPARPVGVLQEMRLRSSGDAGRFGGTAGDLP